MNKDKIIKDLKERNDKLANQYRLRDIRCINLEKENTELKLKLKEITKRIRKAIDDEDDDLLYALFDIQDIIQDEEEQKRAFDKYIKPYIRDKETEEAFNNFNGGKKGYEFE